MKSTARDIPGQYYKIAEIWTVGDFKMPKYFDCVVLTYNVPHRKTYNVLCLLKSKGVKHVLVFAIPMHYKKTFVPLYEHRPPLHQIIKTEEICRNFGYDYMCSDGYENIPVESTTPLLVCGAGIIPQEIIKKYTVINSHPGYIPLTRGLDALKWAIIENKPIGVTTHLIGDEIDAGEVIQRKIVPVYKNDTFHAAAQRVYEYEVSMLVDSLKYIAEDHYYVGAGNGVLHKRMPPSIECDLLNAFDKYVNERGIERIRCNMKFFNANWDFDIVGISTIDYPVDNTLLLVKTEDKSKLENLENCRYCVVVAEDGIYPSKKMGTYNFFIMDKNPETKLKMLLNKMKETT